MSASQNNLSLVLNQQDSAGTNLLNRLMGPVAYAGIVGVYSVGVLTGITLVALTLPTANVLQFVFKNTHATAGVIINATIQSGSTQLVTKVQPGGVFVNWCASTSGTAGYTAISLTSDTIGATYEMFLGG